MNKLFKIIIILSLITCFSGMAQGGMKFGRVHALMGKDTVTIIHPLKALKYISPYNKFDTIYLSVLADSLGSNYVFYLFIQYPKNIDPTGSNLMLGFPNGTIDSFKQASIDLVTNKFNYVDYRLDIKNVDKLKDTPIDYIRFKGIAQVIDVGIHTYFMEFFRNYQLASN